jgi:hypothetical protein
MKTLCSLLLLAAGVSAQQPAMQPFAIDWQNNSEALSDVSFLLSAPAGKAGFIGVRNGHLAYPDGRRFRIWGVNMTGQGNLPSHEDAPKVAAHLARFGINCIRMHFLDRPGVLIDNSRADTRALDREHMELFDFFVAELKKRGIYVDLNLNVGRTYKAGDGVKDAPLLGFAKALTYFDDRLLTLQREYASQLLTHFNPYTKTEYRNEPAVLLVELVNENSIVESWVSNRLLGKNTRPNPGTWADITAGYEAELTAQYHAWLAKHDLPPEPRMAKSEIAGATVDHFRRELRFYQEIEDRYFQTMRTYLKDELKVKALLLGTSDHNHGISGYPLLASTSRLDVVDGHIYWQHPHYTDEAAKGRRPFTIANTPMVDEPQHSTVVDLSRSAFAGKPYVVSEVNHPFPSEYAAEGIPILTAYAALQDWDGIFWYTFEHVEPKDWKAQVTGHFEVRTDPSKMAAIAAGALAFLRGDVHAARQTVTRTYSRAQVMDSLRLPQTERPYFTPGFPPALPLVHGSRIQTLDGAPTAKFAAVNGDPIVSDTGELAWRKGIVTVDTPRTEAIVGRRQDQAPPLRNLAVDMRNSFGAVVLTSLDGAPIAASRKMLLVAGTRIANTGQQWNEKRTTLVDWGTGPNLIEPLTATVTLRNLANLKSVEVAALDGAGCQIGDAQAARKTAAGWEFGIGGQATTWYLITGTQTTRSPGSSQRK